MTRTHQHSDAVFTIEVEGANGLEHRRVHSVIMDRADPSLGRPQPELRPGEVLVETLGGQVVVRLGY